VKKKFESLIAEYGTMAIIVYFTIFGLTITGFATAIKSGVDVEGAAETTGVWGAAWLATKLTQPIRIGATFVLTPLVAAVWHRTPWGRRRKLARDAEIAAAEAAEAAAAAKEADAAPSASDPDA
jgi:hypothetical protein